MTNTQTMKTITLCKDDWLQIIRKLRPIIMEMKYEYENSSSYVKLEDRDYVIYAYENLTRTYDKSPDLIMEYKEDGLMEMHQAHTYGNPVE